MANEILIRTAELALCRGLADFISVKTPGRLLGLCNRLKKTTDIELARLPFLSVGDKKKIINLVMAFEKDVGWGVKDKHIMTVVSFLLDVMDGKNQKISDVLNQIADYFERVGDTRQACYWAGSLAGKKWDKALLLLND